MIVVNPLGGGGLGSAQLAMADATAADVLAGKKFYSGDKALQTGTFIPTELYYYGFTLEGYSTKSVSVGAEPNLYMLGWATVNSNNRTVFCAANSAFYEASTAERGLDISVSRRGSLLDFTSYNSGNAYVGVYVLKKVPVPISADV